jgi:hypothetical protein
MHYTEILDRIEAILEDSFSREIPPSLWDELDSVFDGEELDQFKAEVANEFDVEVDIVFKDVVNFEELLLSLGSFPISEENY